jgi:hypothetical protein
MPKNKTVRVRVPSRMRRRKKRANATSAAGAERAGKLLGSLLEQKRADFEPIAKLISPNPPEWLVEHLEGSLPSISMSCAVEMRQPTRAEMLELVISIREAAALLIRALGEPSVCEFLDAGVPGTIQLV